MKRISVGKLLLLALLFLFSLPLNAKEPENLHTAKQAAIFYHDSGEYDVDREAVAEEARHYLRNAIREDNKHRKHEKLAVVFDIDETSLSNYENLLSLEFAYHSPLFVKELEKGDDPAVNPTLRLYDFAREHNVAVFFITGRTESLRAATEKNLREVGYTDYVKLIMKPDNYDKKSVIPYKSGARESIEAEGYRIVVNIGDQWSDLAGGHSKRVFKLPNPYYYIP